MLGPWTLNEYDDDGNTYMFFSPLFNCVIKEYYSHKGVANGKRRHLGSCQHVAWESVLYQCYNEVAMY